MKKTRFIVIIALILVFSMLMTACGGKAKTKEELARECYLAATEKMSQLDSLHQKSNIKIKGSVFGMEIELPMSVETYAVDLKSQNPYFLVDFGIDENDMIPEINYSTSADNQYFYMTLDNNGEKIKVKFPRDSEDFKQFGGALETTKIDPQKIAEYIKNIDYVENSDKTKTVTAELDTEKFNETIGESILSYIKNLGGDESIDMDMLKDMSFEVSDAKAEAKINQDGYFETMTIHMDISIKMKVEGVSLKIKGEVDAENQYLDIGKDLDIERPNPDDYLDYDSVKDLDELMENQENGLGPAIGT